MDATIENINMCKSAVEIQHRWWIPGDYYAEWVLGGWSVDVFIGNEFYSLGSDGAPMKHWIWLPKQDQFQVMILTSTNVGLVDFFDTFLVEHAYDQKKDGQFIPKFEWKVMSMEQLWLAFVMDEKFNKHWNGTTWEANDENKI